MENVPGNEQVEEISDSGSTSSSSPSSLATAPTTSFLARCGHPPNPTVSSPLLVPAGALTSSSRPAMQSTPAAPPSAAARFLTRSDAACDHTLASEVVGFLSDSLVSRTHPQRAAWASVFATADIVTPSATVSKPTKSTEKRSSATAASTRGSTKPTLHERQQVDIAKYLDTSAGVGLLPKTDSFPVKLFSTSGHDTAASYLAESRLEMPPGMSQLSSSLLNDTQFDDNLALPPDDTQLSRVTLEDTQEESNFSSGTSRSRPQPQSQPSQTGRSPTSVITETSSLLPPVSSLPPPMSRGSVTVADLIKRQFAVKINELIYHEYKSREDQDMLIDLVRENFTGYVVETKIAIEEIKRQDRVATRGTAGSTRQVSPDSPLTELSAIPLYSPFSSEDDYVPENISKLHIPLVTKNAEETKAHDHSKVECPAVVQNTTGSRSRYSQVSDNDEDKNSQSHQASVSTAVTQASVRRRGGIMRIVDSDDELLDFSAPRKSHSATSGTPNAVDERPRLFDNENEIEEQDFTDVEETTDDDLRVDDDEPDRGSAAPKNVSVNGRKRRRGSDDASDVQPAETQKRVLVYGDEKIWWGMPYDQSWIATNGLNLRGRVKGRKSWCPNCKWVNKSIIELLDHIFKKGCWHQGKKGTGEQCKICKAWFKDVAMLDQHKCYQCEECDAVFINDRNLREHIERSTVKCTERSKFALAKNGITREYAEKLVAGWTVDPEDVNRLGAYRYKCPNCHLENRQLAEIGYHRAVHGCWENEKTGTGFQCSECKGFFKSEKILADHICWECRLCHMKFAHERYARRHVNDNRCNADLVRHPHGEITFRNLTIDMISPDDRPIPKISGHTVVLLADRRSGGKSLKRLQELGNDPEPFSRYLFSRWLELCPSEGERSMDFYFYGHTKGARIPLHLDKKSRQLRFIAPILDWINSLTRSVKSAVVFCRRRVGFTIDEGSWKEFARLVKLRLEDQQMKMTIQNVVVVFLDLTKDLKFPRRIDPVHPGESRFAVIETNLEEVIKAIDDDEGADSYAKGELWLWRNVDWQARTGHGNLAGRGKVSVKHI